MKRNIGFLLLLAGCTTTSPDPAPPPWTKAALQSSAVPTVYATEWKRAENRGTCAPIAFRDLGQGASATPRRAEFSGGWGVAYDLPDMRSAFGVAGTGTNSAEPSYSSWPHVRNWKDGSTVGYGPEGGTGPNQLAYLSIAGQACLYNVWSRLGKDHLEHLLEQIRFVATNDLK